MNYKRSLNSNGESYVRKNVVVERPVQKRKQYSDNKDTTHPESCRALKANIEYMYKFLGQYLFPTNGGGAMKDAVMNLLKNGEHIGMKSPKFSKYSGIQEWENCISLFVNVDSSNYDNVWSNKGANMTWFAQQHQTVETRVIRRMLESCQDETIFEQNDETDDNATYLKSCIENEMKQTPILLFIRNVGEAYVFCGAVKAFKVFLFEQPIRFIWNLNDWDTLQTKADYIEVIGHH